MDTTDFLVVGAGLAGAATAWRLAQRGLPVTLVEREVPASERGSSHGSARILRFAYPELDYVQLVQGEMPGWRELEGIRGVPLLTPTQVLDFGARRDPRTLAAVLARARVPHNWFHRAKCRERWPGIAADTDVLVHDGAVIDAHAAVEAMVAAAAAEGAQIRAGWALIRLLDPHGYREVIGPKSPTDRDADAELPP